MTMASAIPIALISGTRPVTKGSHPTPCIDTIVILNQGESPPRTTMKRSSDDAAKTNPRKLRLLLHAVDGCVPFLTPETLERYFPPSDDLWIGMAVRDTCVMPTFAPDNNVDTQPPKKTKKPQSTSSAHDSNATAKPDRDPKKPRGYTFAPNEPDSWLLPYTRVTVPSFNWMEDNARHKSGKGQMSATKGSTSTNQHILVWTPHGRQKLSPEQYGEAASSLGLKSHYTLSLYDMHEEPDNPKRLEKADARNEAWFQDLLKRRSEESSSDDSLWSPVLLPSTDSPSVLTMYHDAVEDVAGVALIGRWRAGLESILQDRLSDIPHVAMLATYSLSEILEIAASNVIDTIGTDLPTTWAKATLALAVDLTEPSNKRAKWDEEDAAGPTAPPLNKDGCMDLSDKVFARDPKPLVPGCQCLACANDSFSRAYIHHLICAKELLADILLFGHNLHHLLGLIRKFNSVDDRQALVQSISSQLQ